ncbi:MAG: hypothetical protein RIC55_25365 [Pirellulaceae bacterium]
MDARQLSAAALVALAAFCSLGASARTQNFIVQADTPDDARLFAETAERCRRDLAMEWLGKELPPWSQPCPVKVTARPDLGAGGATSFMFDRGRPFGWTMNIQGSRERLVDSVIPHEVTHTIFATHFGRPLPRWADEGACTSIEAEVEKSKHKKLLIRFLTTGQGIAFNRMFAMTEYPENILPLYSQGYSVARYLIAQGGKQRFVAYVGEGMQTNNWPGVTRKYYGFADLSELQVTWLDWVREGCPSLDQAPQLAGALYREAVGGGPRVPVTPVGFQREVEQVAAAPDVTATAGRRQELLPVDPPTSDVVDAPAQGGYGSTASVADSSAGWYSRQRDLAASPEATPAADAGGFQEAKVASAAAPAPYRPGSIGRSAKEEGPMVRQSLARQQPIGRPTQTVLEAGSGYQPLPGPARNSAGVQRY